MRRWLGCRAAAGNLGVWGSQLPAGSYPPKKSSHDREFRAAPPERRREASRFTVSSTHLPATVSTMCLSLKTCPLPPGAAPVLPPRFISGAFPCSSRMLLLSFIPCTEFPLTPHTISLGAQCLCCYYSLSHQYPFPNAGQTPVHASRPD